MHWFQSFQLGCVTRVATLPWNALLALSVSIEFVSSSARVPSVKSAQPLSLSQFQRTGPIDRIPGTPGSDKKFVREKTTQSFTYDVNLNRTESEGLIQEAAHHSTEVLWLSCVNIPFMVFFVSTFS